MISLAQFTGFEWDRGNRGKNWVKHRVSDDECEEVFFNLPLVLALDEAHSAHEARYHVLGKTHAGRPLFVVVTSRGNSIRVISARDMTQKERRVYDETEKASA